MGEGEGPGKPYPAQSRGVSRAITSARNSGQRNRKTSASSMTCLHFPRKGGGHVATATLRRKTRLARYAINDRRNEKRCAGMIQEDD